MIEITVGGEDYSFRKPTQKQWDQYITHMRGEHAETADRQLALMCAEGDPDAAAAMLEKYPAVASKLRPELAKLAGRGVWVVSDEEDGTVTATYPDKTVLRFRRPDADAYEAFKARLEDSKKTGETFRLYLTQTCESDKALLEHIFAEYPASCAVVTDALAQLAGIEIEVRVKKD
jgi:hypothetical protein